MSLAAACPTPLVLPGMLLLAPVPSCCCCRHPCAMGRLWLAVAQLALPCHTCRAVSHLPQLDPLAVSVFVIKCLSQLRCPLLGMKMQLPDGGSVLVRDELLDAAMSGYSEDVRASMVEHVLASMPPMQAAALQVSGGLFEGRAGAHGYVGQQAAWLAHTDPAPPCACR